MNHTGTPAAPAATFVAPATPALPQPSGDDTMFSLAMVFAVFVGLPLCAIAIGVGFIALVRLCKLKMAIRRERAEAEALESGAPVEAAGGAR